MAARNTKNGARKTTTRKTGDEAKPTYIHMKVEAKLKRGLAKIAKAEDKPLTSVIRGVLTDHVKHHAA